MSFTYEQAVIIGFIQGLTELFPISSLGHAILIPAWIGGSFREFISEENQAYLLITIVLLRKQEQIPGTNRLRSSEAYDGYKRQSQ